ncbi:DedA family protein [Actinomadura madurae]|uniref:Membrane protein DedA, SNARE-associated domain n=1 Tax=Actinomadura madurae TaxID=1993 RepID=A0A1I5IWU0_9ACTN|nr:DedA family protein [Actinomadura madurae]SFO64988.1 membrane protein DedA, SNARE-associated domain [Actinomadura madurae]
MLEQFNALVDGLPPAMIYLIVAALVFAEAALFVGFVFPGETAIVVGGVLASQHVLSLWALLAIAVVAAVAGDSVGYEVGRRYGPRLLDVKVMRRHRAKVAGAQDLIRRRGAFAVFIGRFTALLRALMPALAGSSRLPYPTFLLFNVIGGVTWVVTFTLGGFFAGAAFEHAAKLAGRGLAIGLAVAAVVALAVWSVRKRRLEAREEAAAEAAEAAAGMPEAEPARTLP